MKIIIAVTTDIHFDQRVCKIANALIIAGHTVLVVGRLKADTTCQLDAFDKLWLPCWFKRTVLFYAEYNLRLFWLLIFKKFDVVCACDLDTILGSGLIAKLKHKVLVFDAHEYMEESVELRNKSGVATIWNWIAKLAIPWTNVRMTVSESLAQELSTKYKTDFAVIRNVPQAQVSNKSIKPNKVIWYQGAINAGRGLELVLECLVDLPEYRFHLAGTGDILEQLKIRTTELKLENRIHYFGRLSYQEMQTQAQQAFVGIDLLESTSKSYWYSLSNKTFDYMHAGLPSIQMNFPEYIKINERFKIGILLPELSKELFITAIRKLENLDYYSNCVHACQEAAKVYNWEKESIKLVSIYNQLQKTFS